MRLWVSLILLVSLSAGAQSVKYYALTPQETKKVLDLRAAKDAAIKAVDAYDEQLGKKYAMDMVQYPTSSCISQLTNESTGQIAKYDCSKMPKPTPEQLEASRDYKWKDGWANGIQYSEDFKIIVPAVSKLSYSGNGGITTCFYPSGGYYNQFGPADFNYGPNGMLHNVINTPVPISSGTDHINNGGDIVDQYGHIINLH